MQHVFGKRPHRTTLWRRLRAYERPGSIGKPKRGRGFSEDVVWDSFVRFTAAVIANVNETGHCDRPAIWQNVKPLGSRFRYRAVPEELYNSLAVSGFPPPMLAVAVCDWIPLNFKTRQGAKPQKLTPGQKADRDSKQPDGSQTLADHSKAFCKAKFEDVLRQNAMTTAKIREYQALAAESDYTADWVRNIVSEYQSPADKRADGKAPMQFYKGTPAHRILFSGARLSRRMASYWKHHPKFRSCLRFVHSLFNDPDRIPRMPYDGGITTTLDPALLKQISLAGKARRQSSAASLPVA